MENTQANALDAEELFYLAIKASQDNKYDKAIQFLKQSISLKPTGYAYFLLSAQYAEIAMFERAIESIETAIELSPDLWIAHLQLGMLYLSINQNDNALKSWEPLSALSEDNSLFMFKNGLSALVENKIEEGKSLIKQGIQHNSENAALNQSMIQILEAIQTTEKGQPSSSMNENSQNEPESINKIFLAQYNKGQPS